MKNKIKLLFIFSIISLLFSCATITRTPEYVYSEKCIRLHIKSDPQLNLYKGKPHTLVLCVYQLRDPNTFNQIAGEDEGLSKLLEGSRFDSSVTSSKKFVIHPDTEISETLDRSEGTKYVCIVAGYYELEKDQMFRRIPIPLSIFTKQPKKLNIDLILGSQEIQGLRVK